MVTAQNVGVDVATPIQKLDVAGRLKIGSTTTDSTGDAQWVNQNAVFSGQAGDGLILDSPNSELDVNTGDGITVNSDLVEVVASDLEGDGLSVTANNFNVKMIKID